MTRFKGMMFFAGAVALTLGLGACMKTAPAPTAPGSPGVLGDTATPESLVAQWKAIADAALKDPRKQANVPAALEVTQKLASAGAKGLDPLLDILADPSSDPRTKMLVTMTISPVLTKDNLKRVVALTDTKYEVNTRVNAAHMVASFNDPALNQRAAELLKDPEPRVRFSVFNVQLMRAAPEALALVEEVWKDPKAGVADKGQLVNGLPDKEAPKHLALLAEAAGTPQLDPQSRGRAILLLGRVGDATALAALEKCAKSDPDPELKKTAEQAWEALKSRLGDAPAVAAPAQAGTAMSAEDIAKFTEGRKVIGVPLPTPAGTAAKPEGDAKKP